MSHKEEHNHKNLSPEALFRLLEDADMPVSDAGLDAFEQEALEGFAELENPAQARALHADIQQQIEAGFMASAVAAPEKKATRSYFRLVASLVLLFSLGTVLFFWLKPEVQTQVSDNGLKPQNKQQQQQLAPAADVNGNTDSARQPEAKAKQGPSSAAPMLRNEVAADEELAVPDAAMGEATAEAAPPAMEVPEAIEKELEINKKAEAAKDFKPVSDLDKNEETPAYRLNETVAKFKAPLNDSTTLVAAPATSGSIQYWNNNNNAQGYYNYATPSSNGIVRNGTTIEHKSLYPSNNATIQAIEQNSVVIIANKKAERKAKTKQMTAGASAAPNQAAAAPAAKPATADGKADFSKQTRLYDEADAAAGANISPPVFAADTTSVEAWLQKNIGNDPRFSSSQRIAIRLGIGKDGKVAEVRFVKAYTNCDYCETRVTELLKAMPAWKPASSNGQAVYGHFDLSFRFQQ